MDLKIGGNYFNASFRIILQDPRMRVFSVRYRERNGRVLPFVSVLVDHSGEPAVELYENEPGDSPVSIVTVSESGLITVSDKPTERFMYKVEPASERPIIFGKLDGGEVPVRIGTEEIRVGPDDTPAIFRRNLVVGFPVGVVLDGHGNVTMAANLPDLVQRWITAGLVQPPAHGGTQ